MTSIHEFNYRILKVGIFCDKSINTVIDMFIFGEVIDYISLGDYYFSTLGMTSSQRPDVVPGNAIESATMFHKPMSSPLKYTEFDDENSSISALNKGKQN